MAKNDFTSLRDEYGRLWRSMTFDAARASTIRAAAKRLYSNMHRYLAIEKATGVPASFIAVAHERESGARFDRHLHNGDPLTRRTFHVPAGRPLAGSPPFTWEESAEDALRMKGLDKITDWSIERTLYELERYNGFGYRGTGEFSPYLWAGSNHSDETGKYVADGKFSASAVEQQLGVAPLLKALWDIDPALALPRRAKMPPAEVAAPSGSGIAVGTGMLQSGFPLWQAALVAVGVAFVAYVIVKIVKRK